MGKKKYQALRTNHPSVATKSGLNLQKLVFIHRKDDNPYPFPQKKHR